MKYSTRYCTLLAFLLLILSHQTFPQTHNNTGQKIYSQFSPPVFETISIEDGLPENSVTCILQDYLGYMWFGTQNGLAKYDGYSMTVYKPDKANNKSISGGIIICPFEDNSLVMEYARTKGPSRSSGFFSPSMIFWI
ncbi:MAG: hypothetical protein OQK29_03440 [Ignavibacteriaceae bacterium]|nr:hypothetical protein [Ignavibacteriaceae bacterium]